MPTIPNVPEPTAPAPVAMIQHRNGTVQRIHDGWLETDIPGLPTLFAVSTPDQASIAARLGYGDDLATMNREHDQLHALVADWLGLPASFSLTMAAGGTVDPGLADLEERAVMALQEFMVKAGYGLL